MAFITEPGYSLLPPKIYFHTATRRLFIKQSYITPILLLRKFQIPKKRTSSNSLNNMCRLTAETKLAGDNEVTTAYSCSAIQS